MKKLFLLLFLFVIVGVICLAQNQTMQRSNNGGGWAAPQFGASLGDGVNVIQTGVQGYYRIPSDMTITGWDLVGNATGSLVVDVCVTNYSTFPPTASTSIWTTKPAISNGVKNQASSLSINLSGGSWIMFNVDSASIITKATLAVYGRPR